MKRRMLSVILTVCLVLATIPMVALKSHAADTGVQDRLNEVLAEYPHGSFFSKNGQKCGHETGQACDNCKLNSILSSKGMATIGGLGECWTCYAFARYVLIRLYGKDSISMMGEVSRGRTTDKATFANAQVGDIVYFVPSINGGTSDYGKATHLAIIAGRSDSGVTLYDSNFPYTPNKVHHGFVSYSQMTSFYTSPYCIILHYVDYDKVNGSTVSKDPSTLAFKSPNAPKTLKQGSYFGLTGTVTSNYNITSVYGRIKNSNNTTVDSYQQKNINSKSFTIAYSGLDDNLEFNLLSPGAYYLTYEATDTSGKTVSWKSDTFYIQSSTPCKSHTKGTYKFAEAKHPHYQYWECAVCGNNFTDGSTKKLDSCTTCNPPKPNCDKGHTKGEYRYYTATHPHYQYWKCAVCGKDFTDNSTKKVDSCTTCNLPKPNCDKGHTWSEWEVIEEPTCVIDGKGQRVCSLCGEIEQLPVMAYKHNWSDWSTVVEPSCGVEGLQERVCNFSTCDERETQTLPALAHDYRVKQETDTSILKVCANCGDSVLEEKEPTVADNSGMVHFVAKNRYSDGLFRDVKNGDWFSSNVATAYSMGLMNGTGGNSFSPGNNMTLAEVVTLAARIHRIYYTGSDSFPSYDGGNWYDPYVNYARDNGIIDANYAYSRPATREEVVHILARALPEDELANTMGQVSFADSGDITYMADVRLLSGAGVINGIQENGTVYFKPLSPITRAEVAAVVGRMVQPDTRVATSSLASPAVSTVIDPAGNGRFAVSKVNLNGERAPGNRTEETNLGDLITDAMIWQVTKDSRLAVSAENVVAITNGGSIRAGIPAGDITREDVNWVLPFGNTVATIYISGAALLEALEASTFCTPTAVGGFPQVSGIDFSIDTAAVYDAGENYPGTTYAKPNSISRVTIKNINGKPFDPAATYAVVTNNSLAAGGDTYCAFQQAEHIFDTGVTQENALISYINEQLGGVIGSEYANPQGRIAIK